MDPNELLQLVSLDRVARTEKTQTHPEPGICFLSTAFLTTTSQRHWILWNGGVRRDVHSLFDQFQSSFDPFERSGGDPLPLIQIVDEFSTGNRLHPIFSPSSASLDRYLRVQQILHPNPHDLPDHRSPPGHHPPHRHQTGPRQGRTGWRKGEDGELTMISRWAFRLPLGRLRGTEASSSSSSPSSSPSCVKGSRG